MIILIQTISTRSFKRFFPDMLMVSFAQKIIGAVVGAFFIGVINNGMSLLGVGIDWQQAIKGFVLLLAVFFDVYN